MSGIPHPSALPKLQQSPYLFLDIHDTVIQGLIHFTRQPEIGHSSFDTFDLWLYILTLGFPREQGFYTKFYHESPPQPGKEKTLFDGDGGSASSVDSEDEEDEDGSGGIMIEVWKVEGYYAPARNGNVWVSTKNEIVLLLFCHSSSWDTIEMPISRLKKELRENVIQIQTPLQTRLLQKCKSHLPSTKTKKGIHTAIACGSCIRMFKYKSNDPECFFCHVNWNVDLGSGVPSMSAKAVETFMEGIKEGKGVK
ncbi:hypothetical protein E2P81_ATG05505 [Venturia nashicola]|uniref:Uncharacterized protein n=1 Tax=Venturia nashicola TaxID=86259 RepID=A0A4Z1P006_9PEZI|nr:hypothetical protein E6O75_ATG05640 [Venturia nashicola]TLD32529.1 hypothetical protein E2P81_ATG05505 [Venturia nashicola]